MDNELEQQILIGGFSTKIRRKALHDPDYKLTDMLLDGRRDEMSSFQALDIEHGENKTVTYRSQATSPQLKHKKCQQSGRDWHPKLQCPAKEKTCNKCFGNNHFANVCRQPRQPQKQQKNKVAKQPTVKPLHHAESDTSDDDYLYAVNHKNTGCPTTKVNLAGKQISVMIDTGASINVLDDNTFQKLKDIKLEPTKVKALPFSTTQPVHVKRNSMR